MCAESIVKNKRKNYTLKRWQMHLPEMTKGPHADLLIALDSMIKLNQQKSPL